MSVSNARAAESLKREDVENLLDLGASSMIWMKPSNLNVLQDGKTRPVALQVLQNQAG